MSVIAEVREKMKRGILEMMILELLREEDKYAYQLKKEMNKKSGKYLLITELVLYPPLKRMVERGYVTENEVIVCEKRKRVYYHIEPAGMDYLRILVKEYNNTAHGVARIMGWEPCDDEDEDDDM